MSTANIVGNLVMERGSVNLSQPWIQIAARLDLRFGGIASSLPSLCRSIGESNRHLTHIVGFCGPDENTSHLDDGPLLFTRVPRGRVRWISGGVLHQQLARAIGQSGGVHIHGIWDEHSSVSAGIAHQMNKPYIVSAHGMLDRWALNSKRLKKAAYSSLFERSTLQRASCLRALTREEVDDYRRFGANGPAAVIPNGVDIPEHTTPNAFIEAYPKLRDKRLVLFLGRIHYKKGLDALCRAWSRIATAFEDTHLVLAGPDFENTQDHLVKLIESLGISKQVTFTGMLGTRLKWSALAAASLFVLPSYSEGFSVALLEALAARRPVVISRQCNFPEVETNECGCIVEPSESELEEALRTALSAPQAELDRAGQNGRDLVNRRYSWSAIGAQMRELHEWLTSGAIPQNVEIY